MNMLSKALETVGARKSPPPDPATAIAAMPKAAAKGSAALSAALDDLRAIIAGRDAEIDTLTGERNAAIAKGATDRLAEINGKLAAVRAERDGWGESIAEAIGHWIKVRDELAAAELRADQDKRFKGPIAAALEELDKTEIEVQAAYLAAIKLKRRHVEISHRVAALSHSAEAEGRADLAVKGRPVSSPHCNSTLGRYAVGQCTVSSDGWVTWMTPADQVWGK